ncbi:MAG: hypothetical protein H7Y43_17215, partial [Akkermansiaceae bacterium]|nr:hypothetical protein [Verrucomicrobiales bacterium]
MRTAKLIFIFSLAVAGWVSARAADWLNAGLLFDDVPLTLATGHRMEALGPLFYSESKDMEKTWAIPPLLSHHQDAGTDSEEWDFLYPIATLDRFGSEYRWHIFQLWSFAGGEDQEQHKARRFTLFPIYFQQRSQLPEENYTALFPFYGHLKKRVLRDEIFFVMFPIYAETRKKDVVTKNYVYPFFHLRQGDGLKGWQFWPITGHEHKDVTQKTNGFGDVQLVPGRDSRFVLWPIYLNQTSGIGTTNVQHQHAILPLYSIQRSPLRDSTTVGWPFFSHITDREKQYREWQLPWPFIVFARGEGKTTTRVWPLFSQAQSSNLQSRFYLWPVYKYNRVHGDAVDRGRTRIMFFLYSDIVQRNLETGKAQHRVDFFPFYTFRKDYDGSSRLQVLAILEPFLPQSKSIERDYSPLWSLWRSEQNPKTGARSQSLLWNLYRRDVTPAARKCSLLFGLFQYQSGSDGRRVRLIYVPLNKTQPTTEPVFERVGGS